DLLTQLRTLAATLPQGTEALESIFEETGRINQYDPIQDYLNQTLTALEYRLQREPQNRDWAYTLALSKALKRQVKGAIAALERVVEIDSQNPYAYAYLAFVHLYDWHPAAAQKALKPALAINPNLSELQALNGVATLLQGNLVKAWQILKELKIPN
ncbi:phospholipid carrier-dependent glycosyltransferase, partial [Coleofasciculus sp. FACHB-712]|nr:phospholipid carrier-dependent glycosyltransferase [Coleofasciculus sp. FACHB-712]